MPQATGPFDVARTPQSALDAGDDAVIAHNRFDKQFHGALEASSVVHMLAVGTGTPGSAAYVALERITGTLDGLPGSFHLQHAGSMSRGAASLVLTVVPDSGTDALLGLSGRMAIDVRGDVHNYTLDYELRPDAAIAGDAGAVA